MLKGKNTHMNKNKFLVVTATTLAALGLMATATGSAKANEVKDGDNTYWVVESGDTLSKIAQKYNVSFELVHANNTDKVSNADLIFAGQKILVNGTSFDKNKVVTPAVTTQVEAPVKEAVEPVQEVPVEQAPVETVTPAPVEAPDYAPVEEITQSTNSAKEWIASKESSGSYDARNGRYVGRYQLDASYLNGDFSPANQERVVEQYIAGRYGSWENAQSFWVANGWY